MRLLFPQRDVNLRKSLHPVNKVYKDALRKYTFVKRTRHFLYVYYFFCLLWCHNKQISPRYMNKVQLNYWLKNDCLIINFGLLFYQDFLKHLGKEIIFFIIDKFTTTISQKKRGKIKRVNVCDPAKKCKSHYNMKSLLF